MFSITKYKADIPIRALVLATALLPVVPSIAETRDGLVRIHYDLEVASYCGLATESVVEGFRNALKLQTESADVTQHDVEQARMQAWKEAHWEWENRGLGGFKGWCANEAVEGARRLELFQTD